MTPTSTVGPFFRALSMLSLVPAVAAGLGGCADDGGDGRLVVDAFALEEARTGIPSSATADGFSATFDHVVLQLEGFSAEASGGGDADLPRDPVLVELVPSAAQVFAFDAIGARRWDQVGYSSMPPSDDVRLANDVDPAIVDEMVAQGWSHFISGTIEDADGTDYPFALGFPIQAAYAACRSGRDGTDGLVVPVNGIAEVEITWHLTHLFFDSFAEDSSLRLEPFAAVYDGVDPIDFDDLAMQPLADIRGIDGEPLEDDQGNPVLYIPPPGGAETLREHVLAARFGHFDGLEGFCMTDITVIE